MYEVYYMNRFLGTFATRDEAFEWIMTHPDYEPGMTGEFEVL